MTRIIYVSIILIVVGILIFKYVEFQKDNNYKYMVSIIDSCLAQGEDHYKTLYQETCQYYNMLSDCALPENQQEGLKKIKDELINKCISSY